MLTQEQFLEQAAGINLKHQRIRDIVQAKEAELNRKGTVYTGSMRDGKWVPTSLYDVMPQFGVIVDLPGKDEREEGYTPEPTLDGMEFLGGSVSRAFYVNMEVLNQYPIGKWFAEQGDPHLLASMFLRPGKTAVENIRVNLPQRRVTGGEADGTLFTLNPIEWKRLLMAYRLPMRTRLLQVTLCDPNGIVAKGTVRMTLPGAKPATYTDSFKWLELSRFNTLNMSVLTTDDAYRPDPSMNGQEVDYHEAQGGKLAEWALDEVRWNVQQIVTHMRDTPDRIPGYLSHLGYPTPDAFMQTVHDAQRDSLINLLRSWKLRSDKGWRGKAAMDETVKAGHVLLPRETKEHLRVGDTVYVNRNPNLPMNGYVKFIVQGFHDGNFAVFNWLDEQYTNTLGGDVDGDDVIVLFLAPFDNHPYTYDVKLQEYKSNNRAMAINTPEARLTRWVRETNAPIGQYDMLARYAIDLGKATPQVLLDITKAIQFVISLKKRDGNVSSVETSAMVELRKSIGVLKEVTGTYYLNNYRRLTDTERVTLRHQVRNSRRRILAEVEHGLEAIQLPKPRFTDASLRHYLFAIGSEYDPGEELHAKAVEFVQARRDIIERMKQLIELHDEDGLTDLRRELKRLTQVTMPQYALSLSDDDWIHFSAELFMLRPEDTMFWLWSVHPGYLTLALKDTYAKEKQMLYSSHGHPLEEGDGVILMPYQRDVRLADGTTLKLSNGIVALDEPTRYVVIKKHAKSVVLEPL